MSNFTDVMLDIETFGTSSDAVVIQVALQRFDRNTGELGEHLVVSLDPEQQVERGLIVEAATVQWWSRQDQNILSEIRESAEDVSSALHKLRKFITFRKDTIWSHTFDTTLMQNVFKAFEINPAWSYTRCRDLRTLVDLSGIDLKSYDWDKEKTHAALDDCKFQIKYAVDAMNAIRNGTCKL